jgi:HAD superfamily hydrolase (TIGR01509 family)
LTEADAGRGLFLDLDGTLADSLPVMQAVYERFLAAHGKTATADEFDRLNGPPLVEVIAALKDTHALPSPVGDLLTEYAILIVAAQQGVQPMAGARALVEAASDSGWIVGVVTSGNAEAARTWLDRVGLADRISVVIGADEEGAGKPAPDPYLAALDAAGCRASVSVAIEDTSLGATAAVAAGLRTYVLGPEPDDRSAWPDVAGFVDHLDAIATILADA